MNKNKQKDIAMIRFSIITAILFSLLAASCTGRKEKIDKNNLIPEKDFISVLTEIHIADGLLVIPKIRNWYSDTDSILNYINIIQSHGYTREEMDRTIRYYFIKKPKNLIRIYDEVLGKLSEMESRVEKEIPVNGTTEKNMWKGNSVYSLPDPSGTGSLLFDQQLETSGYYTLTFTLTLYPDDQSLMPRFTAYFSHPDSVESGKRDYFTSFNFLKDGRPHKYTFTRKPLSDSYIHLRGWFIDCDKRTGEMEKHVKIENIIFTCIPALK